ncbi:hypothetical protein BOX15_Mlig004354g2, partial [Macrostomum lignano]
RELTRPVQFQGQQNNRAQSAEVPSQTMLGKLKTAAKNRAPVFSTKQQQQQRWKPKNADVSSQASPVSKDSEKLPPLAQQPKRAAQQKQQQQKLHLPAIDAAPVEKLVVSKPASESGINDVRLPEQRIEVSVHIRPYLDLLETVSEEWRLADKTARKKFDFLLENVIGGDSVFVGPFGLRKLLYFDYVASGRSLRCIEDFIQSSVLPRYGNTHSSGSLVALQSNAYREEARHLIKKCVNAGPGDALIFTGSGATGAVQTLIGVLELQERRRRGEKLAVVHGPFEHHSNLLPWRELADVCTRTPLDSAGGVDMAALEATLKQLRSGEKQKLLLIGAFSAASNVTGTVTDTASVTAMLHAYGAIAVWDYACAGPYVSVDMNPRGAKSGAFDALLLSPHKFVGGPGTPGVLVAKRHLFANRVPHRPGGGTVDFVTRDSHQYEADVETREEGGTPAIVDCIRCGLVFRVKRTIGDRVIENREAELLRWAWQILPDMESVLLLGNRQQPRLPIFSFLVVNRETGLFLHHNFVAILLNDLYGVQSRAGCACAGPYASDLLEFDQQTQNRYPYLADGINRLKYCMDNYPKMKEMCRENDSASIPEELEILKPGFVRVNLPYFYTNEMVAFLFHAIDMISQHGWKLLPEYTCNPHTGAWRHTDYASQIASLKDFRLDRPVSRMSYLEQQPVSLQSIAKSAANVLQSASNRIRKRLQDGKAKAANPLDNSGLSQQLETRMRWFAMPDEAADSLLLGQKT